MRRGDYDVRSTGVPVSMWTKEQLDAHMKSEHGGRLVPATALDPFEHHKRLHQTTNPGHIHYGEAAGGEFATPTA